MSPLSSVSSLRWWPHGLWAFEEPATEELLAGLGFRSPGRSYEVLSRLIDPSRRMGKVLSLTFPLLAPALALAADPDQALVRLERVADAVGDRHGPADTLAAEALSPVDQDVLSALLNLGCGRPQAVAAVRKAKAAGTAAEFEPLFRRALELVR